MRSNLVAIALVSATLICLAHGSAKSEGPTAPAARLSAQGDVQQLKDEVKKLEEHVRQLENKLNGENITLGSGSSKLAINPSEISITSSGRISIRAAGEVRIKGSKVTQN